MSTIVKTGAVLTVLNNSPRTHIYGDLHVVGSCAILYFLPRQSDWPERHGILYLPDRSSLFFERESHPYSILVLPAHFIRLDSREIHPVDMLKWTQAGGGADTDGAFPEGYAGVGE